MNEGMNPGVVSFPYQCAELVRNIRKAARREARGCVHEAVVLPVILNTCSSDLLLTPAPHTCSAPSPQRTAGFLRPHNTLRGAGGAGNTNTRARTHRHTCTHIHIHRQKHKHTPNTYTHTHAHAHTQTNTHIYIHAPTQTHTRTHTDIYMPAHILYITTPVTHIHTHTDTHTHTHTHIHTHICTNIHTETHIT